MIKKTFFIINFVMISCVSISANEVESDTSSIPIQKLAEVLKNTINASINYHTFGIEEKVRVLFLHVHSQNPQNGQQVKVPYRTALIFEAAEGVISDLESLSEKLKIENKFTYWNMVETILSEISFEGRQKIEAYIKLKRTVLEHSQPFIE